MNEQYGSYNDVKVMVIIIVAIGVSGFLILRQLADWIGVDFNAALGLVISVVCAIALLASGVWCQATDTWPLTVANVCPLVLAILMLGFSPTLNQLGTIGPSFIDFGTQWWARTSLHYGFVFMVLVGGYGYFYLTRSR